VGKIVRDMPAKQDGADAKNPTHLDPSSWPMGTGCSRLSPNKALKNRQYERGGF